VTGKLFFFFYFRKDKERFVSIKPFNLWKLKASKKKNHKLRMQVFYFIQPNFDVLDLLYYYYYLFYILVPKRSRRGQ
jgi:hypothetical protein